MSIEALAAELAADHPVTGAYNPDAEVALSQLRAENITKNKTRMSGSEVMNAIVPSEFGLLSSEDKQTVWDVLHLGDINPFGVEATLITSAFGVNGTDTIAALAVARTFVVSRLTDLGLGDPHVGDIIYARSL